MKRLFSALLIAMFSLGSFTAMASGGDPAPDDSKTETTSDE